MSETNKPEECGACHYPTDDLKEYRRAHHRDFHGEPPWWLCPVCRSTFTSNAVDYHYENEMLYRSLAYCTNMILDAIAARRPAPVEEEATDGK